MKHNRLERFLSFLGRFAKEHISMALVCVLLFFFYRNMVGDFVILIVLAFLVLYGTAMAACYFGMIKLEKHQRSGSVTGKRVFGLSILISMPIYYLWMVVSLIPIVRYELWLLTGLPLVIITGTTLFSVVDHWRENKAWFWLFQVGVYLCMLLGGQLVIHLLF